MNSPHWMPAGPQPTFWKKSGCFTAVLRLLAARHLKTADDPFDPSQARGRNPSSPLRVQWAERTRRRRSPLESLATHFPPSEKGEFGHTAVTLDLALTSFHWRASESSLRSFPSSAIAYPDFVVDPLRVTLAG